MGKVPKPGSEVASWTEEMFDVRHKKNLHTLLYFLVIMCGLAVVVILFQSSRRLRASTTKSPRKSPSIATVLSRVRHILMRKVPFLPSAGHAVLAFLYIVANIILCFTNIDSKILSWRVNLASRFGWMAVGNTVLIVFLAMKNTPLAILTPWSYEKLNMLHQVAGCLTVLFVITHASLYMSFAVMADLVQLYMVRADYCGMVAGCCYLIVALAGLLRRWGYETFYYTHLLLWVCGIIALGIHQPERAKKVIFITITAASLWVIDRTIRVSRLVLYGINNTATLTPLANGATRVTLKKGPLGSRAGKHCYLWIPCIRAAETHPFTIASSSPTEFVIASYDGFTRYLHKYAQENPGAVVRASVEGSYGTYPNANEFDHVLLVAGGSGASFIFGVALEMLKSLRPESQSRVDFVWMVKQKSNLTWFDSHLTALQNDSHFNVDLFVTRQDPDEAKNSSSDSDTNMDEKKSSKRPAVIREMTHSTSSAASIDSENIAASTVNGIQVAAVSGRQDAQHTFQHGRPDVAEMIKNKISSLSSDQRILIMGCGPQGLMKSIRNATASAITSDGPTVELHCEEFGW